MNYTDIEIILLFAGMACLIGFACWSMWKIAKWIMEEEK
jgi:hypothetical protein